MRIRTLFILAVYLAMPYTGFALPAFPGAEGFGANAKGGRGGIVCEVANLNDSGSGSLRACVEKSGARTVVFRVGGTITLKKELNIRNPYITIAGQTAPGDGITLKKSGSFNGLAINTHDVIVRFIRIRPGEGGSQDGINIGKGIGSFSERQKNVHNIIIDHVSVSWAVDENISAVTGTHDITVQWTISSESLNCSSHGKGCHGKGALNYGDNLSWHHSYFAHNQARNPQSDGGKTVHDYVNNLVYNYGEGHGKYGNNFASAAFYPDEGECWHVNMVGNYYKKGPNSHDEPPVFIGSAFSKFCGSNFKFLYTNGNIGPGRLSDSDPQLDFVRQNSRSFAQSTSRYDAPPVRTTSATQARDEILQYVGASLKRDSVDIRVINDFVNGTGRIIDNVSDVGGWPALRSGTPPQDSDHDGMPDSWEIANGFDPNNPADRNGDRDGDGYTNLEEYLNGLVAKELVAGSKPWTPQNLRFTDR